MKLDLSDFWKNLTQDEKDASLAFFLQEKARQPHHLRKTMRDRLRALGLIEFKMGYYYASTDRLHHLAAYAQSQGHHLSVSVFKQRPAQTQNSCQLSDR